MNRVSPAPDILDRISGLRTAIWTYAGLAACFELGIVAELGEPASADELATRLDIEPELVADLIGVLAALGAVEAAGDGRFVATPAFEAFRSGALGRVTSAAIRSDQLQTADALRRARAGALAPGWDHRDPDLIVAQGETAGLFRLAAEHVLPSLPGLRDSLERPGARFLDVGAGIGVISAELCAVYPELAAECLEPNPEARRIGRERIRSAGFGERVAFRAAGVEELDAVHRYDLAIVPQPFLSAAAFGAGLARVGRALRPGGWLLVLTLEVPDGDPLSSAASRIRARLWGGGAIGPRELVDRLARSGFDDAHVHPPVGGYRMYAGRVPDRVGAGAATALAPAIRA